MQKLNATLTIASELIQRVEEMHPRQTQQVRMMRHALSEGEVDRAIVVHKGIQKADAHIAARPRARALHAVLTETLVALERLQQGSEANA